MLPPPTCFAGTLPLKGRGLEQAVKLLLKTGSRLTLPILGGGWLSAAKSGGGE